jgi:chemotaxis signal transduction protein
MRVVILERSDSRYVVEADQISSIERDENRALVLRSRERSLVLEVDARIRFEDVTEDAFYALPRVLREACSPWVRGIVDLNGTGDLAVWIDLFERSRE